MKINDFKLERYFAQHEFNVKHLLCASDCESWHVKDVLNREEDAKEILVNLKLNYTDSRGHESLREEIAGMYGRATANEILTFSGAEEGIFIFMNSLLNKGDHVIVQTPNYQALEELPRSIGCEVTKWPMIEGKKEWDLDVGFLNSGIKKNTKLIVINSPHNPTGYCLPQKKLDEIVEIADKNGIYILSDEVYRYLEKNADNALNPVSDDYDNGVSLNVMSKSFGLPGLRIGWMAINDKKLYAEMASYKDYTTICNGVMNEFIAAIAIRHRQYFLAQGQMILDFNRTIMNNFFEKYEEHFGYIEPQGGSLAFPRIKFDMTSREFCGDLLKKKQTLLLPGELFDYGNKNFRMGFGRDGFEESLDQLEDYIKEGNVKKN